MKEQINLSFSVVQRRGMDGRDSIVQQAASAAFLFY
jgi:hypothetical protein